MTNLSVHNLKKQTNKEFNYIWTINDLKSWAQSYNYQGKRIDSPTFPIHQTESSWSMYIKMPYDSYSNFELYLILRKIKNIHDLKKKIANFELKIGNLVSHQVCFSKCTVSNEISETQITKLPPQKLTNEIIGNALNITCSFIEINHIDKLNSDEEIIADLKNSLNNQKNCDVTFIIGDQQIKAHKFMLQCRSVVFEKMFEHNSLEKQTNEIIISNVTSKVFDKMLEFIYTNKVEGELSLEDVQDLLDLAEKYQLKTLKELCGESFEKFIFINNALDIYLIAERYNLKKLIEFTREYIKNYKTEIVKAKNADFYLKNPEALKLLLELM